MYSTLLGIELQHRWTKVQTSMLEAGAVGCLVSSNANLYYLSGRIFSGWIYLPVEGLPLFFVRRPVGLSGKNIYYIRKPEEITAEILKHGLPLPSTLMLECDAISHNEYERYQSIFQPRVTGNATQLLRSARSVKTAYEVTQIKRSSDLHTAVYAQIPTLYVAGMSEQELSIEIERVSRLQGALGIFRIFGQSMEIFMGSVLAGDNADAPSPYDFALGGGGLNPALPIGANGTALKQGMSVMVDLGGNYTGYMTDMSRVFSVGRLSGEAYRAHEVALAIQQDMIEHTRPGMAASELYNRALTIATEANLADYFMGHRQQAGFVGHGIGIEINEMPVLAPRSRDILKVGMVFAFEPKFVLPGVGAVGIENSFVVTDSGVERLTSAPDEILCLQNI